MQIPPPQQSSGGSKVVIILAIVFGVIVVGVGIIGVMAALGIFGMRKYLVNAKAAEGREAVTAIARGVVSCAGSETTDSSGTPQPNGLPPSTAPVPASLDDVSGRKYMSAPSDWKTPGWDCIGFSMATPQYFQYQWLRNSPTDGTVRGVADLDGDHTAEVTFEVEVRCTGSTCTAGMVTER